VYFNNKALCNKLDIQNNAVYVRMTDFISSDPSPLKQNNIAMKNKLAVTAKF